MPFQVGVVIPLYNAQPFLRQAVDSALAQPEVHQIIIVDDASSDGSFALASALASANSRVQVLQHAEQLNRGAGATRNLGLCYCDQPYIAFLDADDYYLPERFARAQTMLEATPALTGVYEGVGTILEDNETRQRWQQAWSGRKVTGLTKVAPPERLFEILLKGGQGHFHLDGLTVRREGLEAVGPFNESLRLHQDTEFCLRLAATTQLQAGRLQPVAMRRFHASSRILAAREHPDPRTVADMYEQLLSWGHEHLDPNQLALVQRAAQIAHLRSGVSQPRGYRQLLKALVHTPSLVKEAAYWKLYLVPTRRIRNLI